MVSSSSSRAISACESVIEKHAGIRDSLYPITLALYYFQYKNVRNEGISNLFIKLFRYNTIPRNVIRHFLAAIEIIEVLGGDLPISLKAIALTAQKAERIAQSLRASEALYENLDNSQTEKLIVLNQQLGLPLAAKGILRVAALRGISTKQAILAERLGLWEDALELYHNELQNNPNDMQLYKGKLNCLKNLSQYKALKEASSNGNWPLYLANAEWRMFEKKQFLETVSKLSNNTSVDGLFLRSLSCVMKNDFNTAKDLLKQMQLKFIDRIFPVISEDYEQVYNEFTKISFASEINEVIKYKKLKLESKNIFNENRDNILKSLSLIKKVWEIRYDQLPDNPNIMHHALCIRSLVLKPKSLKPQWLKFLNCAIKYKRYELLSNSFDYLKSSLKELDTDFKFVYSRFLYCEGKVDEAIKELPFDKVESYYLLSKWNFEKKNDEESHKNLIKFFDNNNFNYTDEQCSFWSQVNYTLYEKTHDKSYLIDSLDGLLKGILLRPSHSLSFTLRILSILFQNGFEELYQKFQSYLSELPLIVWIEVLPQIIARTNSNDLKLKELIENLLLVIGKHQPQLVLHSLMVPLKSESSNRQKVAQIIFNKIQQEFPNIVSQILILSNELIRVATSWWEMWFSQIEEASRAYVMRKNKQEMVDILLPYHKFLSEEPKTFYELMFIKQFNYKLEIAKQWLIKYNETQNDNCLLQAWTIYIEVFHQLKPLIADLTTIKLSDASPLLLNLQNTDLFVPGTYEINQPLILLTNVESEMVVMRSKQRPRKMALIGSDGTKFTFLLKANEDTRLDERVMQLFSLVNSIILQSKKPLKEKLTIITYKVMPITQKVGLIGWVPNCNTLYDLVKMNRKKHEIPLEIEYQTTMKFCPKFESLPYCDDKLIGFQQGMKAQPGNDLKNLMLTMADDSNHWIEHRTLYTTSLAMTSMVGYILGLGDRHLCNIMIKKRNSKLVHIDFGDCFEVAMHRDKFPEKVPFRLTRMLQNALEVSKIDGTFRYCCQNVMSLLRENGEQILGLLEVFIYDPLLQWITEGENESKSAINIIKRIDDKLKGKELGGDKVTPFVDQVDYLIKEATDPKNLCMMFIGWYPWW
ncbi:PIKK family atypical protein kinase [Histomonas meleagridis]|uniref:PIKK family atypical protein kinase n=1 Tax=Histomonas meleagridis TaxID=135588 RepID=UPI00355A69D8|nr:PIKK family atypical protein kinase [Histomonas meleagridis]KAH0801320.1 PIKK family atypical protein kinase [Histomonas meleagridis]